MPTMNIDGLLAPVSDDAPAGADLTYVDHRYSAITARFETARNPGPAAEAIDWATMVDEIVEVAGRTRDVTIASYLARAGARAGDLDVTVAGCMLLAGILENYWETGFPSLEEDGFGGRKGPCDALTKVGDFLNPLKRIELIGSSRHGRFAGEDFIRFAQQGSGAPDFGDFRDAVAATSREEMEAILASFDSIRNSIERADAVLRNKAEGQPRTDFDAAFDMIDAIREALAPYAGVEIEKPDASDQGAQADTEPKGGQKGQGVGRIETRTDVLKAIDAVIDYYRRAEPGSPIPMALKRVRGWVPMDFLAILRDIAPETISEFERVLIAKADENQDSDS